MKTMMTIAVALCLLRLSVFADTNGISLTVNFSYTEMLDWECFNYSITLSNGSSRAIQILKDPRDVLSYRFIFDLGTTNEYCFSHFDFDDKPRKWDPTLGAHRLVPLPAGESYTWDLLMMDSQLYGANEIYGVTNMAVRCIFDTNKWVKSNTVQLKFYPKESTIPIFDESVTPRFERLYKAKLGDTTYLYNELRKRICELPEDDMPDIQRNPNEKTISISFPKSKRKILYNAEKGEWKNEP